MVTKEFRSLGQPKTHAPRDPSGYQEAVLKILRETDELMTEADIASRAGIRTSSVKTAINDATPIYPIYEDTVLVGSRYRTVYGILKIENL